MGYDKLERNLIDIVKEEQAKLGFFKEDIRLYYPLSSLNHFFNANENADASRYTSGIYHFKTWTDRSQS